MLYNFSALPFSLVWFGVYFQCWGFGMIFHAPQANRTATALPKTVGTCHNTNDPAVYICSHLLMCQKSIVTTNPQPFISNSALPPFVYTRRNRHPRRIMRNPELGHLWAARFILSRMESVNENKRQIQNAGDCKNSAISIAPFCNFALCPIPHRHQAHIGEFFKRGVYLVDGFAI